MSFSKIKIIFRCDSGFNNELGSGHLFRSITIARYLKERFKLKNNQISFVIRINKKNYNSYEILKNFRFKIIKIKNDVKDYSVTEAKLMSKFNAELIIIDRLGKINKKFLKTGLKNFKKKVIIDDSSDNRVFFDLSINPLISNVKYYKNSLIGLKNFISPIYFYKSSKKQNFNKGIFLYLGNLNDKSLIVKIINFISKINNTPIYLPISYSKNFKIKGIRNKFYFFKNDDYYKFMQKASLVIISGGLGLFDALFLKKKIICIPQFKHQKENFIRHRFLDRISVFDKNSKKFNDVIIKKIKSFIDTKKISENNSRPVSLKNMNFVLNKIGNLIDDKK